jgi:hypothetical protein
MKRFLSLMGVAMLLLTSCSKKDENLKVIPKDAICVLSFDLKSLSEKADVKELQNLKSFQKLKADLKEDGGAFGKLFEELIADPMSSGIDLRKNIYNFYLNENTDLLIGVSAVLQSDSKFKDFVGKVYQAGGKAVDIETVDGRKLVQIESNVLLSWDGNKALLLVGTSGRGNYKEKLKQFFSLDKKEQVANVDGFDDFVSGQKDINVWLNFGSVFDAASMGILGSAYQSMLAQQKDTKMYGFVDFGKDKIEFKAHVLYGKEYAQLLKKYNVYDASFNKELLRYFPEKMFFELGGALNMKNYYELLKTQFEKIVSEKEIETELAKEGLTKDNVMNLLGGSYVFGLTGFENKTYTTSTLRYDETIDDYHWVEEEKESLLPVLSLALDLKDKTIIDKLVAKLDLVKQNDYYSLKKLVESDFYFAYTDKMLFGSTNAQQVEAFLKGGVANNAENADFATQAANSLLYAKLDLNIDNYPAALTEEIRNIGGVDEKRVLDIWQKYSDNIVLKRVDNTSAEFVYNLKRVEKNILNSIFKDLDALRYNED